MLTGKEDLIVPLPFLTRSSALVSPFVSRYRLIAIVSSAMITSFTVAPPNLFFIALISFRGKALLCSKSFPGQGLRCLFLGIMRECGRSDGGGINTSTMPARNPLRKATTRWEYERPPGFLLSFWSLGFIFLLLLLPASSGLLMSSSSSNSERNTESKPTPSPIAWSMAMNKSDRPSFVFVIIFILQSGMSTPQSDRYASLISCLISSGPKLFSPSTWTMCSSTFTSDRANGSKTIPFLSSALTTQRNRGMSSIRSARICRRLSTSGLGSLRNIMALIMVGRTSSSWNDSDVDDRARTRDMPEAWRARMETRLPFFEGAGDGSSSPSATCLGVFPLFRIEGCSRAINDPRRLFSVAVPWT
mmetsp:Transcript_52698/g.111965  ORF Transcript_52698/g.111965 Transcript_52698/m.111965 type:complete len:360 (-) Transcript_52698:140-1219(-)